MNVRHVSKRASARRDCTETARNSMCRAYMELQEYKQKKLAGIFGKCN